MDPVLQNMLEQIVRRLLLSPPRLTEAVRRARAAKHFFARLTRRRLRALREAALLLPELPCCVTVSTSPSSQVVNGMDPILQNMLDRIVRQLLLSPPSLTDAVRRARAAKHFLARFTHRRLRSLREAARLLSVPCCVSTTTMPQVE